MYDEIYGYQKSIILKCGSPLFYRPVYYSTADIWTPNTWTFVIIQNRGNSGCISLSDAYTEKMKGNCVLLRGTMVDFAKISKRKYKRGRFIYEKKGAY
jgi:hypothetical protein